MIVNASDLKTTLSNSRGFIVLDGPNGAGKSTLQARIASYLTEKKKNVLTTREPGGTDVGQKIRSLVLGQVEEKLNPWSEVYLFCADRNEHIHKKILPAINSDTFVVCDRYYYSTLAFQSYGRELDLEKCRRITEEVVTHAKPDIAFIMDIDAHAGLQRTRSREDLEVDSFEAEELAFHERLRNGFLEIAKFCEEPCIIIDAHKSAEEVWHEVRPMLEIWLKACSN